MNCGNAFISYALPFRNPKKGPHVGRRYAPFACDQTSKSPRLPSGTGFSKPAKNQKIKRRSYEKGTVLIQCPTCQKHHIIADNIGMYGYITGGRKNVEQIAKDAGQKVTRVNPKVFGLEKLLSRVLEDEEDDNEQETNSSA